MTPGPSYTRDDLRVMPSSVLVQGSFGSSSTTSATAVKVKEIVMTTPGAYQIRFVLSSALLTNGTVYYGQIFKNGTAIGVQRSVTGTGAGLSGTTFVEDIGGWMPGDLCQVYLTSDGTKTLAVTNFTINGERPRRPHFPIPAGTINLGGA